MVLPVHVCPPMYPHTHILQKTRTHSHMLSGNLGPAEECSRALSCQCTVHRALTPPPLVHFVRRTGGASDDPPTVSHVSFYKEEHMTDPSETRSEDKSTCDWNFATSDVHRHQSSVRGSERPREQRLVFRHSRREEDTVTHRWNKGFSVCVHEQRPFTLVVPTEENRHGS